MSLGGRLVFVLCLALLLDTTTGSGLRKEGIVGRGGKRRRKVLQNGIAAEDMASKGGLMSPIKRHVKHSAAAAFAPPADPVVNNPAVFSSENIGGQTEFTNPLSSPHALGMPMSPNADHLTWPGPAPGYEGRVPSPLGRNPGRKSDYGLASNPPDSLGGFRPMTVLDKRFMDPPLPSQPSMPVNSIGSIFPKP